MLRAHPARSAVGVIGTTLAPREVPVRTLPVPNTVSPELQARIGAPLRPGWDTPPTTLEGWKTLAAAGLAAARPNVAAMAARLQVTITPGTLEVACPPLGDPG